MFFVFFGLGSVSGAITDFLFHIIIQLPILTFVWLIVIHSFVRRVYACSNNK